MPTRRRDNESQPRNMMGRVFGGENFAGEGGPVDWMPSDELIVEQINEEFTRHSVLDGNSIVVTSDDGMVILRGHVRNAEARALAQRLACAVFGVKNVHNEIELSGGVI